MFLELFFSLYTSVSGIKQTSAKYRLNPLLQEQKIRTQIDEKTILEVLSNTHSSIFGKDITTKKLASSWAHIALENNRGKDVWNHNFGNLGPLNNKQKYYNHKGQNGWPYRSFESFEEGAKAYWEVIKRCQPANQFFEIGSPTEAARGLKLCNYFQSSLEEYSKLFSMLYSEAYFKLIPENERIKNKKD